MDLVNRRLTPLLERSETTIYIATALILVGAAGALLILALAETVQRVSAGDHMGALLNLLDRALLVLMLAEIIYTVRRIARTHRLEAEPFFIVAIIAAIRRMLVITAESTAHVNMQDPTFQAALAELGLLALIILALAGSMRIVRRVEREDDGAAKEETDER
ncbi:MAG: phosphate-starvation-inducible PsiE family protein [Marivibrio sp.]|uniref:phosphate-starvation-inducible PsiE family protein n=1 Tax=Marivibrio sp. TaxID=2039719 RepID=UPI0032EF7FA1